MMISLHSTMVLLKRDSAVNENAFDGSLHSTMVLLKRDSAVNENGVSILV